MLRIGEQGTRITRKKIMSIFSCGGETEVIHALCVCSCVYMYMHACGNAWVGERMCMQEKICVLCVSQYGFMHMYGSFMCIMSVCVHIYTCFCMFVYMYTVCKYTNIYSCVHVYHVYTVWAYCTCVYVYCLYE